MKQLHSALKLPILLLLLFVGTSELFAQNNPDDKSCYQLFFDDGIKAFNLFQFETAINKFKAAIACIDPPASSAADEWLLKAQNAYIGRLQLIASKYITSEGQRVFQQENYSLAFRLYQEALKYKSDNEQTKDLQQQLLSYLADYQFPVTIDTRFYDPKQIALTGNGSLVIFDKNKDNNKILIKLINPETQETIRDFEFEVEPLDYQFSDDGKWLAVELYDAKNENTSVSIWSVDSGKLVKTFEKIYKRDIYKSFAFSPDSKKVVYRSEEKMEDHAAYSFSVFDLLSKKTIYYTGPMIDYYAESGDGSDFRRIINQNEINEKISTKFSIEGIVATNAKNYVLKENEFRIRRNNDFAFSPDGGKFAFNQISEEEKTEVNFNSDVSITFGPKPKVLVGKINVINLEDSQPVFTTKSDYKNLPQRFLPFSFSENSNHFIFLDTKKWLSTDLDNNDFEIKPKNESYQTGFNVFDFEKREYVFENEQRIYDYFVTENNWLVTWSQTNLFADNSGILSVYDLNTDALVFSQKVDNDFSHFYDVKSKDNLLYFSTLNPNTSKTTIHVLDTDLDNVMVLKDDYISFDYNYVRTDSDQNKIAFLTSGGKNISVWDLKKKQQIREFKSQAIILEFDFSEDANYLIVRDKNNMVRVVDLKITENIYDYFDTYLEELTPEEKQEFGIGW